MKHILYSLLVIGSFLATQPANATHLRSSGVSAVSNAAVSGAHTATAALFPLLKRSAHGPGRKAPKKLNRAVLNFLGYEKSNTVMSPFKREWRLHVHQQHLQSQARRAQRARSHK